MPDPATLLCTPPALDWSESGPRAPAFDDLYFSAEDGLAEARAVFLQGCGLPQAWKGRRVFTVGELGFGSGLNALALWDLWRREGEPGGWLHLVSIEKHPFTADQARRVFSAWPELADLGARLAAAWPPGFKGAHRLRFDEDRFSITLFQDDVANAIDQIEARVDAWFLDGFAPARNPDMWSEEVMAGIGRLSAPGARAATFTVAGAVRRGLQAAGFQVEKKPGFGRKRERLEAIYPGEAPHLAPLDGDIAIIGGGIAAASLAHACAARGLRAVVFDPEGPAGGASGAPAGLLTPRLEKADRPHVRAILAAFAYARAFYDGRPDFHAEGVRRLAKDEKEAARFEALAELMGEGYEWVDGALLMRPAGRFDPAALVTSVLGPTPVRAQRIARIDQGDSSVRLISAEGENLFEGAHAVIAAGAGSAAWMPELSVSSGHVAVFDAPAPDQALVWGGYLARASTGVLLGASHVKGELGGDPAGDAELAIRQMRDSARRHVPQWAESVQGPPEQVWSGARSVTPDRLPVAGPLGPRLHILAGLGSRGFAHAPLLAEDLLSRICGEPRALECAGADAFAPDRFARRAARRACGRP